MKRTFSLIALLIFVLLTISCQKPEEVTLSKYFQAMSAKDRDTLASMAGEPVAIEFKSWKLLSTEVPVAGDYMLPDMIKKMDQLKKDREKQIGAIQDLRDKLDSLQTDLGEARGRKKTEMQKQIDDVKKAEIAETDKFKEMTVQQAKMKAEVEFEKKLTGLSTSITQNQEIYSGKTQTIKSLVKITTSTGDHDYVTLLKKYELLNPATNKIMPNRLVIVKFQPKEDFEKAQ
jgi:hypothetical protein